MTAASASAAPAAASTATPAGAGLPVAPGLRRRLAALLYEGVLLFGVAWAVGLVYGVVTNQRHALAGSTGLQLTLFAVLGLYFVWFWSRPGQTLAMRTWRLRLRCRDGRALGPARAAARYLLAWLWFLPALALVSLAGLKSVGAVAGVITVGVLAYAALARLRPDRQFFHDVVCGTCVVDATAAPASPARPAGSPR